MIAKFKQGLTKLINKPQWHFHTLDINQIIYWLSFSQRLLSWNEKSKENSWQSFDGLEILLRSIGWSHFYRQNLIFFVKRNTVKITTPLTPYFPIWNGSHLCHKRVVDIFHAILTIKKDVLGPSCNLNSVTVFCMFNHFLPDVFFRISVTLNHFLRHM
jgi:hypothetical protein